MYINFLRKLKIKKLLTERRFTTLMKLINYGNELITITSTRYKQKYEDSIILFMQIIMYFLGVK